MNLYQSVFPEKTFFENIGKKAGLGKLPFNIDSFWSELCLQNYFCRLYICHKTVVCQRNGSFVTIEATEQTLRLLQREYP